MVMMYRIKLATTLSMTNMPIVVWKDNQVKLSFLIQISTNIIIYYDNNHLSINHTLNVYAEMYRINSRLPPHLSLNERQLPSLASAESFLIY